MHKEPTMISKRVLRLLRLPKRVFIRSDKPHAFSATTSLRRFSDDNNGSNVAETVSGHVRSTEWRKVRLDELEGKFTDTENETLKLIQNDTELQPEWKSMESRVTNRRTLTKEETGGKTGRSNIRRTEEDVWLESGLYQMDHIETSDTVK